MSMTLEQYETARRVLEQKMQEAGERERKHKAKAAFEYQQECKRIQSQIGNLRTRQTDLLKKFKQDKQYIHGMYRTEKQNLTLQMHTLRMEYLTVNGLDGTARTDRHAARMSSFPPTASEPATAEQHEEK